MAPPIINGIAYSHSDAIIKFDTVREFEVKELNYSPEKDVGEVRGTSAYRISKTRGDLKLSSSMTLYLSAWYRMLDRLGDGFMEKEQTITVTYARDGEYRTDTLDGVSIKKVDVKTATGSDPIEVAIEIDVSDMKIDGKRAIPEDK